MNRDIFINILELVDGAAAEAASSDIFVLRRRWRGSWLRWEKVAKPKNGHTKTNQYREKSGQDPKMVLIDICIYAKLVFEKRPRPPKWF